MINTEPDLEDLKNIVKGCASGDSNAQEKLYNMFASKMFGVCLRYAKDSMEAEDNLQEGFVKVFTNIKNFRHDGSLEGWVRRIMVNVSLEKYRKQHLTYPVEDVSVYDGQALTEETLDQSSLEDLFHLIQQLPPRYRMVFNLYVMEGLNHREISKKMGISEGTSKSNLARARDILKRKVQGLHRELKPNTKYPV
ncbi:RNA polymerase ECF-type sigma factor [hydrothermal vent metagenome]|uniref:RNA polymerase ECF-type sigma factor n=1 Tax=hydrothermal vent metagenome TaxID=652676 RepID=A0A3B0TDF0_9ZZZZ